MLKLLELKRCLKERSDDIKKFRAELKEYQKINRGWDNSRFSILKKMSKHYRHYHIAYSLLKGKTYDQIEKKCHEDNQPDMALIQEIRNAYIENVCVSA